MEEQTSRAAHFPVSVFLIARDEADRIGPTIEAVIGWADEVLVVDSGSSDDTVAIAERLGARVAFNAWPGYGRQKRVAEALCRNEWVLNLDADEVVPPALSGEIAGLFADGREPACDAYRIRIAEVFPGEAAPIPLAYTLSPVRLYRRSRGRYSASPVHDRVELDPAASVGRLSAPIHHFSVRSLGDQLAKLNRYSDQQADDLDARGIVIPSWRVFLEMPAAFIKAYIGRRHALRGTYGFLLAMNYAMSRHLRLAKHYERRHLKRRNAATRTGRDGGTDP